MKWGSFLILFLFLSVSGFGLESSCSALVKFAGASLHESEREAAIFATYQQLLQESLNDSQFASVLKKMEKSRNPLELPKDLLLDSETIRSTFLHFNELIAEDMQKNPKLSGVLLNAMDDFISRRREGEKKQVQVDEKTAEYRIPSQMVWSTHFGERTHLYRNFLFGLPYWDGNEVLLQYTRDGKKIEKMPYDPKIRPVHAGADEGLMWISPDNGSYLYFTIIDQKVRLLRIPLFDSNSKLLSQTESLPVEETGIPTNPNGSYMAGAKIYFSPDGKKLVRTASDGRLLIGRFLNEQTVHYEMEMSPKLAGQLTDVHWLGDSRLLLIDELWREPEKRNKRTLSVFSLEPKASSRPLSKLPLLFGEYVYVSPDGLEIYILDYAKREFSARRLRDVSGKLGGRIGDYNVEPISLGAKPKMGKYYQHSHLDPHIDRLYFPKDSTKVIQLSFSRDGTSGHEIILRNRDDLKEEGFIKLSGETLPPGIRLTLDGKFMTVTYDKSNQFGTRHGFTINIEEGF